MARGRIAHEKRRQKTRAAERILRAMMARRARVIALEETGRSLQMENRSLYSAFMWDADPPGAFSQLDRRYDLYVAMSKRIRCPYVSLDAADEYPCD